MMPDFKYYLENQEELVKKYNSRWLVIKEQQVVADLGNGMDAYDWGRDNLGEETEYIIQLCTPGPAAYTRRLFTVPMK
ncbi:MAG: hypothetical protein V4543_04750 [Bacteroidota bacterium]